MIEDFGSYLKSERELRGVTLEELHAKTKIPMHYLRALEKNLFDELPEEVFIRGYIRSFAKVIGANESEMLSAYIDITKTAPSTDTNNQSISNQNDSTFDLKFIFIGGGVECKYFNSQVQYGFNKTYPHSASTKTK